MIVPEHKHIIVRAEVEKPIKDTTEIRVWVTDLVEKLGMQLAIVDQGYNPIVAYIEDAGNRGLTACAVIKTSHIACHIWDELIPGLVQLDVYTCSTLEKEKVLEHLKVMKPLRVDYKVFDREYKLDEKDNKDNEEENPFARNEAYIEHRKEFPYYPDKPKEDEGVRRGRETAEYLKSLGYMGGKKDKENADI